MRIDLHAHLWPTDYVEYLEQHGHHERQWAMKSLEASESSGDLARRFADMDQAGVDVQVLSIATIVPSFPAEARSREAARFLNTRYAEIVAQQPNRLKALAHLPLPHIDASLDELAFALDELGMVGVAVTNSIFGGSIVDEQFAPVFEELNRRGSFVFIHPAADPDLARLIGDYSIRNSIGPPVEDTLVVAHLITRGMPARYSNVNFMVPHFGGAAPMLIERMDRQFRWEVPSTPEPAREAAKRLWFDTVGHNSLAALRCGLAALGPDRLVFGSDWPVLQREDYRVAVAQIEREANGDAERILGGSAASLLQLV